MTSSRKFHFWAVLYLLVASAVYAAEPQKHGGFVLGSSLKAAQQHALENDWRLVPLSEDLPGSWNVEGSSLSLFACDGTVVSVLEELEGDLEEFAARVFSMELELGKPDTQILSLNSGVGVMSTIDARFVTEEGGAVVQLQSIGGKRTLSVNYWIKFDCPDGD